MPYKLAFHRTAQLEWDGLDGAVRQQLVKKLKQRLENPRVAADQLSGSKDRYKIKLRSAGFRLVYEVRDELVLVIVIAVGKRERSAVYQAAQHRH